MEKKLVITMNQIDGTITMELSEGNIMAAEALGMLEYAKMLIYNDLILEIND